jgi:hypothetical protein
VNAFGLALSIGTNPFDEFFKQRLPKSVKLLPDAVVHSNLSIPPFVITAFGVRLALFGTVSDKETLTPSTRATANCVAQSFFHRRNEGGTDRLLRFRNRFDQTDSRDSFKVSPRSESRRSGSVSRGPVTDS